MQVGYAQITLSTAVLQCEQQLRPSTVQFTAHTATHQGIYVYHSQHGRPRRREENLTEFILLKCVFIKFAEFVFICNGKYEVELALIGLRIVLLKLGLLDTDTKHRAASLRQQGYMLCLQSICPLKLLLSLHSQVVVIKARPLVVSALTI